MRITTYIQEIQLHLIKTHSRILEWFDKNENLKTYRPIDQGWTIAEILEHIALTSHFLLILIDKGTEKALRNVKKISLEELKNEYHYNLNKIDEIGIHKSFDWLRPEHMEPQGEKSELEIKDELIIQLNRCLNQLGKLKNGEGLLYKTTMSVNDLGKINVYEYIYFLSKHAERHIRQMEENQVEFEEQRTNENVENNQKGMQILVITGPPYSGKGTQCEILEEVLQYKHISTGDRIRSEKENNTVIGKEMKAYEEKGMLVPDELMENLLTKIIKENEGKKGIIFDGYPRTTPQVDTLIEVLKANQKEISQIINIEVPKEELLKRAKERAKSSNRKDDKDESIHLKRIQIFEEHTRPAIQYLKTKMKVDDIDGIGSIQSITERINHQLKK